MHKALSFLTVFFLLTLTVAPMSAQNENPFEISARLEEKAALPSPLPSQDTAVTPANPFGKRTTSAKREGDRQTAFPAEKKQNPQEERLTAVFRFALVVFILSMLAFLLTILRSVAGRSFSAFANMNMLNQLYREQEGRGISPFLLLYAMFLINLGIFIFLSLHAFNLAFVSNNLLMLLFCLLGSFGLFLGKHLLLGLVSFIFPVQKEVSKYHFVIIIFGIVIGFLLAPVNLLLAFGPQNMVRQIAYLTAGAIGLIYAYRYFRAMTIASKFLVFHKFHFLLYICTIEITPAIIILKLLQGDI